MQEKNSTNQFCVFVTVFVALELATFGNLEMRSLRMLMPALLEVFHLTPWGLV